MAVAWDQVRAKLVTSLPGVVGSSVKVYDGPAVTGENPASYITVGHVPSDVGESAGTFAQDVPPDGYEAAETGTVLCELGARSGSTTVPSVFATFDAIVSWLQADMTLGGLLSEDATCTAAANVVQAQTRAGAVQRLLVTISYTTRL